LLYTPQLSPECRSAGAQEGFRKEGNYSDTSKGEYDADFVITAGPEPARQGFHPYSKFLQKHIQAEPADDEMPKMIGRVFTSCSEATFDVDGRRSKHSVL